MRKQTIKLWLLIAVSFPLVFSSCKKEELVSKPSSQENETTTEMTQLGRKLKNPFTVENISKALENLFSKARLTENISVETSHLYVKFKPKTEEELDLLKKDSTLDLYSYPMDYEILQDGSYYHDPSLPAKQPTYQYASVLVDYVFPSSVEYEILAECYIPDDLPSTSSANARQLSNETVDALMEEAFKINGNKLNNSSSENLRFTATKWTPSSRIQVWDNVANRYVGVHDVEVKCRNWLTISKQYLRICNPS